MGYEKYYKNWGSVFDTINFSITDTNIIMHFKAVRLFIFAYFYAILINSD